MKTECIHNCPLNIFLELSIYSYNALENAQCKEKRNKHIYSHDCFLPSLVRYNV